MEEGSIKLGTKTEKQKRGRGGNLSILVSWGEKLHLWDLDKQGGNLNPQATLKKWISPP